MTPGTADRDGETTADPDGDAAAGPDGDPTGEQPDVSLGVDVGGTFTDVTLVVESKLVTAKVPTTDDQSVGVCEGIEKACDLAGIDPGAIDAFTHAMTVSVNALLERDGAKTALVTTEGFRDVLEIGRQDRPALYDLDAEKPDPLVPRRRRFELPERATPGGIDRSVDEGAIRSVADEIEATGAESVAVCLLHAYARPENERRVAETLRTELDVPVSASHEVLAEFREFERTSTTVVDAYVTPTIEGYLGRLIDRAADLGVPTPKIMQANGGIAEAETVRDRAVTTIMSGPAAGVVGAAASVDAGPGNDVETAGEDNTGTDRRSEIVSFDMGGTSTDVSLVRGGSAERTTDTVIDRVPIRTPMVDVNTVGAGGGSIAWVDSGGALRVGPRSAGAVPGPACYDRGGTDPTVTDANVVLGYIGPETALGGELRLDVDAARAALSALADRADLGDGDDPKDALAAARGVYRVANATMTRAIRSVTVERGHDPRRFDLVAFGGAGPMHAAAIADALDIERVVVPKPAGVLSAYGLLAADERHDAVRTVHARLGEADPDRLGTVLSELADELLAEVSDPDRTQLEYAADCRYVGQSFELTVPIGASDGRAADTIDGTAGTAEGTAGTIDDTMDVLDATAADTPPIDPEALGAAFHEAHANAYGYELDEAVEAVNLRVTASISRTAPTVRHTGREGDPVLETREAYFPGVDEADPGVDARETNVFDRARLPAGETIRGPAILEQAESTTVLPPGWDGTVRDNGSIVLEGADE